MILRKEDDILGIGIVGSITEADDAKIHRRCPACESTDIRERATKSPKYRCGKCGHEFLDAKETMVDVRAYTARIEDFARLIAPPTVREVKQCAVINDGIASQLSILQLDRAKLCTLFECIDIDPYPRASSAAGQGFGLSLGERKAVELRAMCLVRELYEQEGWTVIDKSSDHPFDLLATRSDDRRFIEVKGTTGCGLSVMLTHAEVAHARRHGNESALLIVTGIRLEKAGDHWIGTGGEVRLREDPWTIIDSHLMPTQYRYTVGG